MPTRFKRTPFRAVFVLLALFACQVGCHSAGQQYCQHQHEQQAPSATNEHESIDRDLKLAEQKYEVAQLRINACNQKIKTFLQDNPIGNIGDEPAENRIRLRQLIIEAEKLNESLVAIQTKRSTLSDRLAAGEELNELEVAKLEQAELGEQILQEELDKTNALLKKTTERRQRYVKLLQEYKSLAKNLKAAEQERYAAMAEIQALREAKSESNTTP